MDILKIGDIRKFDNGVIGVVSGISNNIYEVIASNGVRKKISMESSYSIPKLKPELRSYLNTLSSEVKYCSELMEKVSEAERAYGNSIDRVNSLIKGLKSFDNQMNLKEFEDAVYRNLGKTLYNLIKDRGYTFKFGYSADSLTLKLEYKTLVKKNASPKNTEYIDDWGKGLKLKTFSHSYEKELDNMSVLCLPFIVSGVYGLMAYDKKYLTIENKNTIMFNHDVNYTFLKPELTQDTAAMIAYYIKIKGV